MPAVQVQEDGERFYFSAHDLRIRYDREHFQQIIKDHPLPRRWRPRDNDRVRLLCDASAFIAQLARLHSPAGSFLAFSRPQNT